MVISQRGWFIMESRSKDGSKGVPAFYETSMVTEVNAILYKLKPFTKTLLPLRAMLQKLPDCTQINKIVLDNGPCVRKAQAVGRSFIDQYKDLKAEIEVLKNMVPQTWRNFKIQKCLKSGSCVSKVFIEQGKVVKNKANSIKVKLGEVSGYSTLLKMCKKKHRQHDGAFWTSSTIRFTTSM